MIAKAISAIAARILTAVALAGAAVLVVALSSFDLPPDWRLASSALADPGGNGKGKGNGGENGNGGSSGQHGPGASSGSGDDDDEAAASARQAGSAARSGRDYIPDEVVVANLEDAARADIRQLGFVVLDEQQLASLGLTITRLRVPRQMTAPTARTLLASRYPDVLVDLNAI